MGQAGVGRQESGLPVVTQTEFVRGQPRPNVKDRLLGIDEQARGQAVTGRKGYGAEYVDQV